MIELEKIPYRGKPYYSVRINGYVVLKHSRDLTVEHTGKIYAEDWSDADTLFFAYLDKGMYVWTSWGNKNKNDYYFSKNFKDNPIINKWLGFWCQGEYDDCISLCWDSLTIREINYIDENGIISKVNLPDVEKIFNSEQEFAKAFEDAATEKANRWNAEIKAKGHRYVNPWDLVKAKNILKKFKWLDHEKENIDSIFYNYCEVGFGQIYREPDNTVMDIASKIKKLQRATSGTEYYTGLKTETFDTISEAINKCENLSDEAKKFSIDILGKYEKKLIPEDWEKDVIEQLAYDDFKLNTYGNIYGINGYSGLLIWEFDDIDDFYKNNEFDISTEEEMQEYIENNEIVIDTDGKVYMIHEGD